MKIGDVITSSVDVYGKIGVVVDFPAAQHPKQVQKVVVLGADGNLCTWIVQYCKVLNK